MLGLFIPVPLVSQPPTIYGMMAPTGIKTVQHVAPVMHKSNFEQTHHTGNCATFFTLFRRMVPTTIRSTKTCHFRFRLPGLVMSTMPQQCPGRYMTVIGRSFPVPSFFAGNCLARSASKDEIDRTVDDDETMNCYLGCG